jgi:hypothetical protein
MTFEVVPSLSFHEAVEPVGSPLTPRVTEPVKPFTRETVTEYVVAWPRLIVWLPGEAVIEKSALPPAAYTAYADPARTERTMSNVRASRRLAFLVGLLWKKLMDSVRRSRVRDGRGRGRPSVLRWCV